MIYVLGFLLIIATFYSASSYLKNKQLKGINQERLDDLEFMKESLDHLFDENKAAQQALYDMRHEEHDVRQMNEIRKFTEMAVYQVRSGYTGLISDRKGINNTITEVIAAIDMAEANEAFSDVVYHLDNFKKFNTVIINNLEAKVVKYFKKSSDELRSGATYIDGTNFTVN